MSLVQDDDNAPQRETVDAGTATEWETQDANAPSTSAKAFMGSKRYKFFDAAPDKKQSKKKAAETETDTKASKKKKK